MRIPGGAFPPFLIADFRVMAARAFCRLLCARICTGGLPWNGTNSLFVQKLPWRVTS